MRRTGSIIGSLAGAALLFTASPLLAHAKLVKSDPAADASVAAPKALSLTFNEDIAPAFSSAELVMAMSGHDMKVPVRTSVAKDGKTLVVVPQGKVVPGAYHVDWAVASSDGHRMKGQLAFKVR